MKYRYFLFLLLASLSLSAQNQVDVLHYTFHISLNDKNDSLTGRAVISFLVKADTDSITFNLRNSKQKGMLTDNISLSGLVLPSKSWRHQNNRIVIKHHLKAGDTASADISYRGIPTDGLIISKNKFGRRTFFSDNWPDRAQFWIPCVDNPADKASVEFIVIAPAHYDVVSNGILLTKTTHANGTKETHWKEDTPLPTKVMVIGVADFAIDTAGVVDGIPVTSWVFPENKAAGFSDYSHAKEILKWFIDYIGPYPYKKLANVQSKTIFGGMENAGAIFYYENSVSGKNQEQSLFAHEIAHQWFGDMATEKSFTHLWLSEGFATYLSHLYLEAAFGHERLVNEMMEDRSQVISFSKSTSQAVVDSTTPYMQLLNANSYQKGGWILHMLRNEVGDSIFHQIIRQYYVSYKGKNADTRDFQRVCEQVAKRDLDRFFRQWLYTAGYPKLKVKWSYHAERNKVNVVVQQLQKTAFEFPLTIRVQTANGYEDHTVYVKEGESSLSFPVRAVPVSLQLDPGTTLLFEGELVQ